MRPLLLLFALLTPALAPAQSAATYRVAGTVVAETSGQPLQHANVRLLNPADAKIAQTTTSDGYGRFAFTGVGAGNHILQGEARGYVLTNYEDHDGFNTGIITGTGTGADTESLVLKLHPGSSITGTVLDESGEPVEHANVRLFRQSHSFGDSRIVDANATNTDDLGRFELQSLAPGTYLLAVSASPWYAVHPDPRNQQQRPQNFGDSIQPFVDPSLDVAYPVTYYPGTIDSSQAAPILLRGGVVEVSLRLLPLPALTITFPYTPQKGQNQPYPQLRTSLFGQLQPLVQQSYQQTGNQLILTGIPPGDYVLGDPRQTPGRASGESPEPVLHLTDHSITADLPAAPADQAHVHVLLKQADGSAVPNGLLVGLARNQATDTAARVNSSKGEATLDVAPGDYEFFLCGGGRHCYVRQVAIGDKILPGNAVHIASAAASTPAQTFTVTFAIGDHTLKGIAQIDGKPAPGAFLLLSPVEEAHALRNFERQQSDLDGTFDFTQLAPGDYLIVAIDNGWDLDWRRDAVLAKYLPAATKVHIADTPQTQLLPTPVQVQPK